ncbi:MAG: flagellar hook capping FlgD N-terminal domain-containing protein [Actinomycetota bacterium]
MPESVAAAAGSTVDAPGFERYRQPETSAPTNELDKDAFLQLLVAQLKYQDPLEPSSSDEFIATSAQFTVIEKLDELTAQGASSALINSLSTAGNLVGREITAIGGEGEITGTVLRSELSNGEVVLVTSEGQVPLNQITSVGPAPTSTVPPTNDTGNQSAGTADQEQQERQENS